MKHLSNSKCKNESNEIKIDRQIKSIGLLSNEINKHLLTRMSKNNNNIKTNLSNNIVKNYYSQKNSSLNNNYLYKNNFILKTSKNINDFSEENIFIYDDEKQIVLTKEEKSLFGDRIMKGYSKIKLLGKGGYGIVWLCTKHLSESDKYLKDCAIKQTCKKKNQESSYNINNTLIK